MVSGFSAAETYTPCVSQCEETHRMAFGRGRRRPSACQLRRQALSSIAFIGEPCPRNTTGIGPDMDAALIEDISIGAGTSLNTNTLTSGTARPHRDWLV